MIYQSLSPLLCAFKVVCLGWSKGRASPSPSWYRSGPMLITWRNPLVHWKLSSPRQQSESTKFIPPVYIADRLYVIVYFSNLFHQHLCCSQDWRWRYYCWKTLWSNCFQGGWVVCGGLYQNNMMPCCIVILLLHLSCLAFSDRRAVPLLRTR